MSLKLNSSGGGSVTLQEPVTASALTLDLPATNATVMTTAGGTFTQPITVSTNNAIVAGSFYGFRQTFSGSDYSALSFTNAAQTVQYASLGYDVSNALIFNTGGSVGAGTERARIDSAGALLVGTTSSTTSNGKIPRLFVYQTATQPGAALYNNTTANTNQIVFLNPNGEVGAINTSGSSTSYGTSSDYRLKENVVPLTGATARVRALNPCRFNFIVEPDRTIDGFLAHEAAEVVPEAVVGDKDEVYENGSVKAQGIDHSKLVPLLTAALQEALGKIDALETRIAALEGASG